jgi:hypothetical protein
VAHGQLNTLPPVPQALVAQQLQLSEVETGKRLQQLDQLLPGLQLHTMAPDVVARMATDVTAVAARLLQVRARAFRNDGAADSARHSTAGMPPVKFELA